jgi:hypothetical protein
MGILHRLVFLITEYIFLLLVPLPKQFSAESNSMKYWRKDQHNTKTKPEVSKIVTGSEFGSDNQLLKEVT